MSSDKNYHFSEKEAKWQKFWQDKEIYKFDPESDKPLYTIDTPPPTVSGKLHLGHVFSYTHAEVIARYHRMKGENVFYPFGLDNNGLPTEKLIEDKNDVDASQMETQEFIDLVLSEIDRYHQEYINLFKNLGFSYDFDLLYLTNSKKCKKMSQETFVDFFKQGYAYAETKPALYCWKCQTAVAQAEVEDKNLPGVFYDLVFKTKEGEELIIATTRPELLPACVAVFVHPEDERYQDLIGQTVKTPLGDKVEVFAHPEVDREKGSGAMMVCSYGDETDLEWIREFDLPEKIIIDEKGRFIDLVGIDKLVGKTIDQGEEIIVDELEKKGAIKDKRQIDHDVGVHERCYTPIEILPRRQWFVKTLKFKDELIDLGKKINWHPEYMGKRYRDWVENLKWDWCISRERFYGVPIPVFYCRECNHTFVPEKEKLPIDPRTQADQFTCPECGANKIRGETQVFDTWFTSSQTPDINGYCPMSIRPQAHDIIRTWAMYTIQMGLLKHNREIPWTDIMISGHILAKKSKISKRTGGGGFNPPEMVKEHSADAIRYAMCNASLGKDAYYEPEEVENGKRLVNKLFNAGKFSLMHLKDYQPDLKPDQLRPIDRWIVDQANQTAKQMAREFEKFEYVKARYYFEDFFLGKLCDHYLEIIKGRLYGDDQQAKLSAQWGLYRAFLASLKMVAPFMPHIAEEMYHRNDYFVNQENKTSIHLSLWPEFEVELSAQEKQGAELLLDLISLMRKEKSDQGISLGAEVERIELQLSKNKIDQFEKFKDDFKMAARAKKVMINQSTDLSLSL